MTAELNDAVRRLLDEPNPAVLSTINPDGSPQTSVVWVGRDGDDLLFSTVEGRVKHRNMLRDPRVSVTVIDSSDPENYVELRGRVSMTPDVGRRLDTQLSWKYDGKDPGEDRPGAVRVIVRMIVEKATGYAALARSRGPRFRYVLGGLGCACLNRSAISVHGVHGTGRPVNAASRSMAGALSRIGCGSANRPARGWLGSWARANVSACSARSSGSSAATPVAWTRSHPCASRSTMRHCSRSAPVAAPTGVAWLRSRTPGRAAAACNAAADRR